MSSFVQFRVWSLLALSANCLFGSGCRERPEAAAPRQAEKVISENMNGDEVATMRKFCAHCHAFPDPQSFPRDAWKSEVTQGFRLFEDSPTEGLVVPPQEPTVAWFVSRAPERLDLNVEPASPEFDRFQLIDQWAGDVKDAVAVSCLRFDPERQQLWACDMRTGMIFSAKRGEALTLAARPLEIVHPCRVTPTDLDGDGNQEILVSELGSFLPFDHQRGAVWSLSPNNNWAATPIQTSISRVTEVQPADFDADGDIDLVVAEFGWRRTGRIVTLWKESDGQWLERLLDKRHGAIDVAIVDLNSDGRQDIVALLSQEFEAVVGYLNKGDGTFETVSLYEAGDPSFGSSGMQVLDFDGDGDYDILHTNGDSSDDGYLKPFHGIRWLENNGDLTFQVHQMATMQGVHRAVAGDLDLDGDLDVVAVSLIPPGVSKSATGLASVIWLEQTSNHNFVRHVVETDKFDHSSCELIDWDSDGDLDICVTHFRWTEEQGPAISWFQNLTKTAAAPE